MANYFDCNVQITDKTEKWLEHYNDEVIRYLYDIKDTIATQTAQLTPVESGELRRSFIEDSYVDEAGKVAYVGSHLEYSIWVEYGTGEYALYGNGRKGGWTYYDEKNEKFIHTNGQKPKRMLQHAIVIKKPVVAMMGKARFG